MPQRTIVLLREGLRECKQPSLLPSTSATSEMSEMLQATAAHNVLRVSDEGMAICSISGQMCAQLEWTDVSL